MTGVRELTLVIFLSGCVLSGCALLSGGSDGSGLKSCESDADCEGGAGCPRGGASDGARCAVMFDGKSRVCVPCEPAAHVAAATSWHRWYLWRGFQASTPVGSSTAVCPDGKHDVEEDLKCEEIWAGCERCTPRKRCTRAGCLWDHYTGPSFWRGDTCPKESPPPACN